MMAMKLKPFLPLALLALLISNAPIYASANDAYDFLLTARSATHAAGPFRLLGGETVTLGDEETTSEISGYDYAAAETHIRFKTEDAAHSFLITPEKVYFKEDEGEWASQQVTALLPMFARLGTLDQFFMLELLNGDRLAMYKDYVSSGEAVDGQTAVNVTLSREQYAAVVEALTDDVKTLLGVMADGMSDTQLMLIKVFARSLLQGLDAEMAFEFIIDNETLLITRINTRSDMADPFGRNEMGSRMTTDSSVRLTDFGYEAERIEP
jgi:hypothetical protein